MVQFVASSTINGCKTKDILTIQAIINENTDLQNINQNNGSVSQEMIDFYEDKLCFLCK